MLDLETLEENKHAFLGNITNAKRPMLTWAYMLYFCRSRESFPSEKPF
jgi:hypothetical protein